MPEQRLGRITKCCSDPDDVVLDPFAGSGSTLVTAKKLGRRFLGFELSHNYAVQTQARINGTSVGDSLVGTEAPLLSAPSTATGRKLTGEKNGRPRPQQIVTE